MERTTLMPQALRQACHAQGVEHARGYAPRVLGSRCPDPNRTDPWTDPSDPTFHPPLEEDLSTPNTFSLFRESRCRPREHGARR